MLRSVKEFFQALFTEETEPKQLKASNNKAASSTYTMRVYSTSTTLEVATKEHCKYAFDVLISHLNGQPLPEPQFKEANTGESWFPIFHAAVIVPGGNDFRTLTSCLIDQARDACGCQAPCSFAAQHACMTRYASSH